MPNELIYAVAEVAARYESGGFEDATEADRRVLDQLLAAVKSYLSSNNEACIEREAAFTD